MERKSGCQKCSEQLLNTKIFIEIATVIHKNKFDYSKVEYKNSREKVIIICKVHGEFYQNYDKHVISKHGCCRCRNKESKPENEWLNFLGLPDDKEHRQVPFKINGKKYTFDGYNGATNTVYEFNGSYWHGDLNIFNKDDINKNTKKTFGDLNNQTLNKEKDIKKHGFNLISIWESEWKKLRSRK